jgi:hypothetical protein
MLKKFLMAAGLAAAFSLSPQAAEAKVKVHIGVSQPGGYCYYNYDPFRCGGYGYYPRPEHFVPHPGYGYQDRVSCHETRWIVGAWLSRRAYDQLWRQASRLCSQDKERNFQG